MYDPSYRIYIFYQSLQKYLPQVGLEPTTFGLEVQRAIHCATGAWHLVQLMYITNL